MNKKTKLGLILGTVLGAIDGLSAWFYPEVRSELFTTIVPGSTAKGLVAGLITGLIARKLKSLPLGILVGLLVAAAVTAPIAMSKDAATGKRYFWEIMIPGALCGAIVGYATQRYGGEVTAAQSPRGA